MALYAFDGTLNDSRAPDSHRDVLEDTHVHWFRENYNGKVLYKEGVGARYGAVGKLIGGVTGAGWRKRIKEQFRELKKQFSEGDTTIDIVGYSRGAAIARMFVHHIKKHYEEIMVNGEALVSPPDVRFLGLFDTVASFGLALTDNEHGFDKEIPDFVEHTYHVMALDETRETFGIERCLGDRSKITEVWFRGGHSDIGGNATYDTGRDKVLNIKRAVISRDWMAFKARGCGLPLSENLQEIQKDEEAPIILRGGGFLSADKLSKVGTFSRRIH